MRIMMMLLSSILLVGCAKPNTEIKKEKQVDSVTANAQKPKPQSAAEILISAGLLKPGDYKSAEFIPGSDNTMILASLDSAPCKMIFRYIETNNQNYWMPNQIGCAE